MNTLTLDGVDVMGERLADEVIAICNRWFVLEGLNLYRLADSPYWFFLLKGFCDSKHHTDFSIETCYCSLLTQVLDVISRKPELTKISFLAHSVGGLVARYAIAKLYRHPNSTFDSKAEGTICGLEAVNFITVATPHLGSRGNKQVLCWLFPPSPPWLSCVQICLFETVRMIPVLELIHSHLLIYVPVFLCQSLFVSACLVQSYTPPFAVR